MENTTDITANIINTINTIMGNLFSSVDNSLYEVLDNLIFVNEDILNEKYFIKIFGASTEYQYIINCKFFINRLFVILCS